MRRDDVASTLIRRHFGSKYPLVLSKIKSGRKNLSTKHFVWKQKNLSVKGCQRKTLSRKCHSYKPQPIQDRDKRRDTNKQQNGIEYPQQQFNPPQQRGNVHEHINIKFHTKYVVHCMHLTRNNTDLNDYKIIICLRKCKVSIEKKSVSNVIKKI